MSYDAELAFKLRQELPDWHKNSENGIDDVKLGEDWRERVYAGDVDVPDVGFAWDKEWFLAGHGKRTRDECGKFKRFMVCLRLKNHAGVHIDGVDYTNKVYHKRQWWYCKRPECPVCYAKGWAVNEANHAEAILMYASDKLKMRIEHFIVSPKQDLDVPFEELKKMALKAMLVRGIVGGLYIYHHFRYHHADETYIGEPAHWFKAPHLHILGFLKGSYQNCRTCRFQLDGSFEKCREEGGCNGFEAVTRRANVKDGFIVKVAEDKLGVRGERKTIGGTIWYQLSHVSLRRYAKKHIVVNYWGVCGRNKLRIPKGALPQKENLCRICGEGLYHGRYLGNCAEYLRLLDVLGFRRSDGVVDDFYDANGKAQWSAVHEENG